MKRRGIYFLAFVLFISLSIACTPPTIHMSEQVPPTFNFTGTRFAEHKYVDFFIVVDVAPENQKLPANASTAIEDKTIWWIWPNDSQSGTLGNLPS